MKHPAYLILDIYLPFCKLCNWKKIIQQNQKLYRDTVFGLCLHTNYFQCKSRQFEQKMYYVQLQKN